MTWRRQITAAFLDPFRGYATALGTSLPPAVRVLDAFPFVRLGQVAVDDDDDGRRRQQQQKTLGRRGHREDPLYRARRLLRRGFTTCGSGSGPGSSSPCRWVTRAGS